ncbi:MAG: hypothetical protein MUE81_14415, partial [Thermoflexibacter sp.]|nr:hypothetical protein [Thermoflexibacter sp.]
GARQSPKQLLESIIAPSAKFASGYEMIVITTKNKETISGIVMEESNTKVKLKIGKSDIREIDKDNIDSRKTIPSGMPPMGNALTKREIRDLIAFLSSLKEE